MQSFRRSAGYSSGSIAFALRKTRQRSLRVAESDVVLFLDETTVSERLFAAARDPARAQRLTGTTVVVYRRVRRRVDAVSSSEEQGGTKHEMERQKAAATPKLAWVHGTKSDIA